jgi:iron complex outermembrane receptor protein
MSKPFILVLIFSVFLSKALYSVEYADSVSIHLSEVQVNANRDKLYSELGRVLMVVEKSEITKMSVQSIDQLLDNIVGVDIRQRGVQCAQADISIRGGSFDQVLVMLNGVNITDPQTGHFNLDIPLNLSDVSRIEILQGSSARVLGPNAFSGAINIVTEKPEKNNLTAELTVGSFNYLGQSGSGNITNERLHTFASVSHKKSDGYIENTDFDFTNAYLQTTYTAKNAGKFDFQLATQLKEFGANAFYSFMYPNQFEKSKTFFASANWKMDKKNFSYNAQAYWRAHHDRFELFRDNVGATSWYAGHNYHLTDVTGVKFSVSYLSSLGKTTIGTDVRNEHIYSNTLGFARDALPVPFEKNVFFTKEANRFLLTGLVDHSINIDNWYFSAGVASTHSAAFGWSLYGGVDAGYAVNEHIRFFVSANSATRLPTFTDLYYNNATHLSDPNLKPEQSKTIELGTKISEKKWQLNASVFYRQGINVIDWIKPESSSVKYESRNLTSINALGSDFSVDYNFQDMFIEKISAHYSFLSMDKEAVGFDSKYALDYLKHKIHFSVNHKIISKLSASWKATYFDRAGTYNDFSSNTLVSYSPYFLVDGRVMWSQKLFDIYIDANNITNASYADYGGLIQPGINFMGGIRLKL